jgi:hypothetical protein
MTEAAALLECFFSVCNAALDRWAAEHPTSGFRELVLKPLEGKTLLVEAIDESNTTIAERRVGVGQGGVFAEGAPDAQPDMRCRISRRTLEDAWAHADDYIAHPGRLDWGWLRGDARIGGG